MPLDRAVVKGLVQHAAEGLNTELKRWLDLSRVEHRAKVVRALLALRNRNGGYLLLGFDDRTGLPDHTDAPPDPITAFHADKIQELVTKHASEPFEIEVACVDREGMTHVVIA